jgi:hypothetical protein
MELVLEAVDSSAHSSQFSVFPRVNSRLRIRYAKKRRIQMIFTAHLIVVLLNSFSALLEA